MHTQDHREAVHRTSDVVTVFARQDIALATIARAMALPLDRVRGMCRRAHESGELQMIPADTSDDRRHALLVELTNVRAQLDDAREQIRQLMTQKESVAESLVGVAGLTRSESKVVTTIAKFGRATKTSIYHALYGGNDEDRDPKIVDVLVCKVRQKLKRHDIEIKTVWGTGYTMDAENIAKLSELCGGATFATVDAPRFESPPLAPA